MIKYSAVIPCKNEEKFIGGLLDCINSQSVKPSEIIVANKSSDKTREILSRYNVKVVEGNDEGYIGQARNNGAEVAKYPLLVFYDADVEFDNLFMENILKEFQNKNLDIATTYHKPNSKKLRHKVSFKMYNSLKRVQNKSKIIISDTGQCIIIKKDVFQALGGFNKDFKNSEDIDLIKRAIKSKYKFGVLSPKLISSVRRFEKNPYKILLLVIGSIGMATILLSSRYKTGKLHDFFTRCYGKTGG